MKRLVLLFALTGSLSHIAAQAPAQPALQSAARTSISNLRPDCTAGPSSNSCEEVSGSFAAPLSANGRGHRALVTHNFTTFGPSINFGNAGSWTITHVIEAPHIVFGTSGIDQYEGASIVKNGTGDLAGLYFYVYGGGRSAQSDEGVTGLTVESGEINGFFHGTIADGGSIGSTSLSLTSTPNAPHNWAATCDGCMLLDISKGEIAGSLNGRSIPFPNTYLNQLPTAAVTVRGAPARLPLTRAWCSVAAAIPPTDTAGLGTSRTVNCTLGPIGDRTPAFTAGGVVTIAGQFYPEQATLTSVGQPSGGMQSLTLLARNPNPAGSLIFQGGLAGQSLSFDDNLAVTGFRTSYYVFGSVDGVNLIYGSLVAGDIRGHYLPRTGSEAETTSSGFHLYPSAEIVANTAQPSAPLLEPNQVPWQNGDIVEDPRFQSFGGNGVRDICSEYTPTDDWVYNSCLTIAAGGPGVSGTYHPFRIRNENKLASYLAGGGNLEPVPVLLAEGPYGDLLQMPGPSRSGRGYNAVINIQRTAAADNTPFNLFALPSNNKPGATTITYDPATRLIGFPSGIAVQSLATSGNCVSVKSPADCGSAASGSFVIAPGTDTVTVTTNAVTANSQILITPDASLGTRLGVPCNKNPASAFAPFGIVARTPGRGFTLAINGTAGGSPNCYSYTIVN